GALEAVPNRAQDLLLLGGLEDVIVLDVIAGGLELLPVLGLCRFISLVEKIKLELGSEIRRHVHIGEPRYLPAQYRPWTMRQGLVVMMIEDVAKHERSPRQPGGPPKRPEIGLHDEIAIALFPVGCGVTRHRLHIDIVGEQIIAAMGFFVSAAEEKIGVETFAN